MTNAFCTNRVCAGLVSGAAGLLMIGSALAQTQNSTGVVAGPSPVRPEFTRPAGTPAAARRVGSGEFMIAPAQPTEPRTLRRKRK